MTAGERKRRDRDRERERDSKSNGLQPRSDGLQLYKRERERKEESVRL